MTPPKKPTKPKLKVADESPEEFVAADDAIIGRALRGSLIGLVLLVLGFGVGLWINNLPAPKPQPKVSEYVAPAKRQTEKVELPQVAFTDITQEAGIQFQHITGNYGEKLLPETMGGGCAVLDYDHDGDADLFLVNGNYWPWKVPDGAEKPHSALFQNDGKGAFKDVTVEVGLDITCYGMGVTCGDYDGDGWTDLFVTAVGKNQLWKNTNGKFENVTEAAGVAGKDSQWSTSSTFFDFNRDGHLDLFVCNYIHWSQEIDLGLGSTLDGKTRAYGPPTSFEGDFCYLYRNEGNGRFVDVSDPMGIQVKNSNTKVPVGKSLGVVATDLDADGYLDLVVANDTVQNFVFHNRKGERFEEIGATSGIAFDRSGSARGAMGIDAAHFRNSDALGLIIGNFADEEMSLYVSQQEPLLFTDEAVATGLGPQSRLELKFGVLFLDFDLDGRLDILSANGHLEEDISKIKTEQRYRQAPQLYWNAGPEQATEFVKVPADKCGPDFAKPMVGRGCVYADFDGDGDLDVLLTDCGGTPRLLRNDQALKHHWLRVRLVGKSPNAEAIGATVKIRQGETWQERTILAGRGYLSQSELVATFGLGNSAVVDELQVIWPNGEKQTVVTPEVDKLLTLTQP